MAGPAVFPIQPPLIGVPFTDPASGLLSVPGRRTLQQIIDAIQGVGGVSSAIPAATPSDFARGRTVGKGGDDTNAFGDFFSAAAKTPDYYRIPRGTYKVAPGLSMIAPSQTVSSPGPTILTGGMDATVFQLLGTSNTPFLTVGNNFNATLGRSVFFRNGYMGGFTVTDLAGARVLPNRHALVHYGLWEWEFGSVLGTSLLGDLLHIPPQSYLGGQDPYSSNFCHYAHLETNFAPFYSKLLNNLNGYGLSFNVFWSLRSVLSGGIVSAGIGNHYLRLAMLNGKGWAFDAPLASLLTIGGAKEKIGFAEIDTFELGIRLQSWLTSKIELARINHAPSWDPKDPGVGYPKTALQVGDANLIPAGGLVKNVDIQLLHRLGISKANGRGKIGDYQNNPNIKGLRVANELFPPGLQDMTAADCFHNVSPSAQIKGYLDGVLAYNSSGEQTVSIVQAGSVATLAKASGYGTAASKVVWGGPVTDPLGIWDAANNRFVVPYTSPYRACAQLLFAGLAAPVNVRVVFILDHGGVLTAFGENPGFYAVTGQNLVAWARGPVFAQAGDFIYVSADNSSGADQSIAQSPSFGNYGADSFFSIEVMA